MRPFPQQDIEVGVVSEECGTLLMQHRASEKKQLSLTLPLQLPPPPSQSVLLLTHFPKVMQKSIQYSYSQLLDRPHLQVFSLSTFFQEVGLKALFSSLSPLTVPWMATCNTNFKLRSSSYKLKKTPICCSVACSWLLLLSCWLPS